MDIAPLRRRELEAARALLERACAFDRAAAVAEEKLFGHGANGAAAQPLGARDGGALVGVAVTSARFLRLLAVAPEARNRGVGSALLAAAEALAPAGRALRTGAQPGNYLAPGVDARDQSTVGWLERRGFRATAESENLHVDLTGNPRVSAERAAELAAAARTAGYQVERLAARDRARVSRAVGDAFSPGWAFELERAGDDVHVAYAAGGQVAAFAAHDGNNRGLGWFGPTGTWPAHRGRGLGAALLLACLVDIAAAGHERAEIAWIGPRDFYERVSGVTGARRFVILEKDRP